MFLYEVITNIMERLEELWNREEISRKLTPERKPNSYKLKTQLYYKAIRSCQGKVDVALTVPTM